MKKILITNVFGEHNKGDKALLESLLDILACVYERPKICAIVRHGEGLQDLYESLDLNVQISKIETESKLKKLIYQCYIHLVGLLYIRVPVLIGWALPRNVRRSFDSYFDADLVVSCPGGFLEDSNKSYYLNLYQVLIANLLKKTVVIAPQSIGPISSSMGKLVTRYTLNRAKKIFVREMYSYEFVTKKVGIAREKVVLTTDLAFFYRKVPAVFHKKNDKILYSTTVNWDFPESDNREVAKERYKEALVGFYRYLHDTYGIKVVLLIQVGADVKFSESVRASACSFVDVDRNSYTPTEIIEKIGESNLFLGSRFHSCIFSMLANVPCISISYLPKTQSIMESLGLSDYNTNIYTVTSAELIHIYEKILEDITVSKDEIGRAVKRVRRKEEFKAYLLSLEL